MLDKHSKSSEISLEVLTQLPLKNGTPKSPALSCGQCRPGEAWGPTCHLLGPHGRCAPSLGDVSETMSRNELAARTPRVHTSGRSGPQRGPGSSARRLCREARRCADQRHLRPTPRLGRDPAPASLRRPSQCVTMKGINPEAITSSLPQSHRRMNGLAEIKAQYVKQCFLIFALINLIIFEHLLQIFIFGKRTLAFPYSHHTLPIPSWQVVLSY